MEKEDNRILLLEKGKRKLIQIVFGRTGIIIVSLIVQILFLFAGFRYLEGFLPYFWGGSSLLSAAVVLFLFGNDDNPTIKLTWFFILAILPVFGLILYIYIKTDLGHRLMIRRYNDILAQTEDLTLCDDACPSEELPEGLRNLATYLSSCGFPCYRNTETEYFPLGDDAFDVMLDELQKAEHFIFLEYFIVKEGYMWGRVLEILKEKVNAGVEVRVMYDGTCAVALLPYNYPKKLQKLGIACKMFAPLRPFVSTHYNYRDHRKIMVIDGQIAFTGGVNLADEYINKIVRFGYWKDSGVRLDGPGAASLANIFLTFWKAKYPDEDLDAGCDLPAAVPVETDCLVQPFADSPVDREVVAKNVYLEFINQARHSLRICTPYLILDNDLLTCLRLAAKRGVDVRIITPGIPDKKPIYSVTRSFYNQLVKHGVRIFEWTPGFCHAKMSVADDIMATCGTINLDYRSLYHHFENGCFMADCEVVHEIRDDFIRLFTESAEVTEKYRTGRSARRRLGQSIMRLFAGLL